MDLILTNYLLSLIEKSGKGLNKDYDLSEFSFTDFELINSYLINIALNDKAFSLLISNPEKKFKLDYYVPVVLAVAVTLFYQNYVNDCTVYQVGDIIQDRYGRQYEIKEKRDGKYFLDFYDTPTNKAIKEADEEKIKNYIKMLSPAGLTKRKSKTKFEAYRKVFDKIFKVGNYLPSQFIYKSVIIVDKKDFFNAVKESHVCELNFHKSLPFTYIAKSGAETPNLPIESMIYLVPDYDTFYNYVLPKKERIDTIIFIGAIKYKSDILRNVKKDIRREDIRNAIFIGNEDIEVFEGLKKWNWSLPELNYLNKVKNYQLQKIEIQAPKFLESICEFEALINSLEEEYTIELKSIFRFRKFLFSLVLPDYNSRLKTQIDYLRDLFKKELDALFKEKFYSLNIDPCDKIKRAYELFGNILSNLPLSKFATLQYQDNINILLVPKFFQEIWREEISKYSVYKNFRNTKVLNNKDFFEKEDSHYKQENVYLLSLFGYSINHYELIKKLYHSSNKIHFLLYSPEIELFEKRLSEYKSELNKEYHSSDRFELTDIKYPKIEDDISVVIENFYQIEDRDQKDYEYNQTEQVYYQLDFEENHESLRLDCCKSVLLKTTRGKRKERVSNLIEGDKVRIYDNSGKEQLFEIALSEDKEGRFSEIDKYSKIWKNCIKEYFDLKAAKNLLYQLEDLISELQENGSTLKITHTLKKWLNKNDKDRFPRSIGDLIALKKTVNSDVLSDNFEKIKKCRKLYRSIMIALGRDLSDEIMDYIMSEAHEKGKILSKFSNEEIHSFVKKSAPLRTIKQIQIVEALEDEQ